MRLNRTFVALAVFAGLFILVVVASAAFLHFRISVPAYKYERGGVRRVLFVGGSRVLVVNRRGEVFASDSGEPVWHRIANEAPDITAAKGSELWGCKGWSGIYRHDARATLWYSADLGNTWSTWALTLPSGNGRLPEVQRRLPAAFINQNNAPPLLLMFDHQLMRPLPNEAFEDWTTIGKPAPVAYPNLLPFGGLAGIEHFGAVYIADHGHLYMSTDRAASWSESEVHDFDTARFSCLDELCFALLTRSNFDTGVDWNELMRTTVGSNKWHSIGSLDLSHVTRALKAQVKVHGAVDNFHATAMLPTERGVYVAGLVWSGTFFVFTRSRVSRGVVFLLSPGGQLQSLPETFENGIWDLAMAPDGHVWTGAVGAFRQSSDTWHRVWSAEP